MLKRRRSLEVISDPSPASSAPLERLKEDGLDRRLQDEVPSRDQDNHEQDDDHLDEVDDHRSSPR